MDEEIDTIIRLKEALQSDDQSSSDDDLSMWQFRTNRGNKLKRGATEIYEGKISMGDPKQKTFRVVEYEGKKCAVVYKRRKTVYGDEVLDDHDSESDSSDNRYSDIKLDKVLGPVTYPGDIPDHPAMKKIYKNRAAEVLATRALETIVEEQRPVVQLARLMSVLLGDDPSYLLSDSLNLPEYRTKDGRRITEMTTSSTNGNTTDSEETNRRITRGLATQEVDPFFALPQIEIDRDFGVSSESAEETRQLTQIALQRSEEFIRCMVKIRRDLLKTDRYRRQVYRMCQMFNGEDDVIEEFGEDPTHKPLDPSNDNN